jgi:hypothetical protein
MDKVQQLGSEMTVADAHEAAKARGSRWRWWLRGGQVVVALGPVVAAGPTLAGAVRLALVQHDLRVGVS